MQGIVNGLMVNTNMITSAVIFLISIYSLVSGLGLYIFAVPVIVILMMIVQRCIYLQAKKQRHKIFFCNDQRGSCITEIFDNFIAMKLSTFESFFKKKIFTERAAEARSMRKF